MDKRPQSPEMAPRRRPLAVPLMVAVAVSLSACSSVPDWANPVTWYDNVFSNDQTPPKAATTAQETAAMAKVDGKGNSKLRSQPEQAAKPSGAENRANVDNGELPDWANPVTWLDRIFGSDQTPPKATTSAANTAAKAKEKGFPSLRSVPEKAPETSHAQERAKVTGGLVADRKHARYTNEKLRGGQPLPPPPVLKAEAEAEKTEKAPRLAAKSATSAVKPKAKAMPKAAPKVALASRPKTPEVKMARATAPPAPPPSALPPAAPVLSAAPQPVPTSPRLVPRSQVKRKSPAAPYPTLRGSGTTRSKAPSKTPVPAPAPALTPAPAPASAAAPAIATAPAPALTLRPSPPAATAPPAPSTATMAAVSGIQASGQSILMQAFASGLAASAATVTTAPPAAGFASPAARPLATTDTTAPDIVRKSYNASLSGTLPAKAGATATSRFSGTTRGARSGRSFRPTRSAAFGPAAVKPLAVISFATGSSHLTTASKAKLRQIVAAHRERGGSVRVVGHASHRTRDLPLHKHKMANFRISVDRANAVARELVRLGVQTAALRIEAVSDSRPIYFEVMPAGEAKNRRAEVFLEF